MTRIASKSVAGEHEQQEYLSLCRAAALHEEAAHIYEAHGFRKQADEEWVKLSVIKRAIGSWIEAWEFPGKSCEAAYKEKKSDIAERMAQILREHMGLNKGLAMEMADALVRGRDLSALALQKGWYGRPPPAPSLDGTALAVGCEKLKRIGIKPEYLQYVDALHQLAEDIGIEEETYEAAVDFMDEEELEKEWREQRA